MLLADPGCQRKYETLRIARLDCDTDLLIIYVADCLTGVETYRGYCTDGGGLALSCNQSRNGKHVAGIQRLSIVLLVRYGLRQITKVP